jgi:hypothetical protein
MRTVLNLLVQTIHRLNCDIISIHILHNTTKTKKYTMTTEPTRTQSHIERQIILHQYPLPLFLNHPPTTTRPLLPSPRINPTMLVHKIRPALLLSRKLKLLVTPVPRQPSLRPVHPPLRPGKQLKPCTVERHNPPIRELLPHQMHRHLLYPRKTAKQTHPRIYDSEIPSSSSKLDIEN